MSKQQRKQIIDYIFNNPNVPAKIRRAFEEWMLTRENEAEIDEILLEMWNRHTADATIKETRLGLPAAPCRDQTRAGPHAGTPHIALLPGMAARCPADLCRRLLLRGTDRPARRGDHPADGQRQCRRIHAADGSRVWLNGESRLKYPAEFLRPDARGRPLGRSLLRSQQRLPAAVPRQHGQPAGRGPGNIVRRHRLLVRVPPGDHPQNRIGQSLRRRPRQTRPAAARRKIIAGHPHPAGHRPAGRRPELLQLVRIPPDLRQHTARRHHHQSRTQVQRRNSALFAHPRRQTAFRWSSTTNRWKTFWMSWPHSSRSATGSTATKC